MKRLFPTLLVLLCGTAAAKSDTNTWTLSLPSDLNTHEGVLAAIEDLRLAMASAECALAQKSVTPAGHVVRLSVDGAIPAGGYRWTTHSGELKIQANSPLAAAHAIERMTWLVQANRHFPPADAAESPVLERRFLITSLRLPDTLEGPETSEASLAATGKVFRNELHKALRYGFTDVIVAGLEDYVPWGDSIYGPRSSRYRAHLKLAANLAHAYGLRIMLYGDEAIFPSSFLAEMGATSSVKDPHFWLALQEKYRRLLRAVPELDGVATRIGEMLPKFGFQAFDLIHSAESEPSPRIEERYRQYILEVHRVVSGEFGKFLLHRTWVTNDWEQHSVADVYTRTFTEAVPTKNLFLARKLTKQDAWYYGSAFNPTFGLTPHVAIAEGEIYSHAHGLGTVVDFPVRWFGAAFEYARLRGTGGLMTSSADDHVLYNGMLYVFARLAWQPDANVEDLTREYASCAFGSRAAADMTAILLMSSECVRHGFYLTPLSFPGWNPIPLTHGNRFVRRGKPLWDKGRGHDEFLHDIYLMCKPYASDVYERVGLGSSIADEMATRFEAVAPAIESQDVREGFRCLIRHTRALMAVNRDYVHTILSYFAYREKASDDMRGRLKSDVHSLEVSAAAYRAEHHAYDLAGIDLTIELANRVLANREQAERTLRDAPTLPELATTFSKAAEASQKLLAGGKKIVPVMTWSGTLDGSALLVVRDKSVEVQNLDYNPVTHARSQFLQSLSKKSKAQWVVRPTRGRGVFYLSESPSPENRYTASVYLEDPAPGSDVFELELCRIDPENSGS